MSAPQPTIALASVKTALAGTRASGIELIGASVQHAIVAYDVAVPVQSGGKVSGSISTAR